MTARKVGIVEHPNVTQQMRAVAGRLVAAGIDTVSVTAAAFNAGWSEPSVSVLLVSSAARCDCSALARFPALHAVVFIGTGTEAIDLDVATELNIMVAHGPTPENWESMAEATVMLMLASIYDLQRSQSLIDQPRPAAPFARMLKGKTVGLIGYGKIGRAILDRLAAWEIVALVYSTGHRTLELPAFASQVSLERLLDDSDIVSVHAALNPKTHHLLNVDRIARLRNGAILINTARGGLIDEDALAKAVEDGRIRLVLDTFATEPLPAESPLRHQKNAILTPHIVGHTKEATESVITAAVENIQAVIGGTIPRYLKNDVILKKPKPS